MSVTKTDEAIYLTVPRRGMQAPLDDITQAFFEVIDKMLATKSASEFNELDGKSDVLLRSMKSAKYINELLDFMEG